MTDTPIHAFPDRGAGEWVAYADYAAAITRAEKAETAFRESALQELASLGQAAEAYGAQLKAEAERDTLQAEVDRLRGGIRSAIETTDTFQRQTIFRSDGQHSKHDLCAHGEPQYNDCVDCVTDYLEALLQAKPPHTLTSG